MQTQTGTDTTADNVKESTETILRSLDEINFAAILAIVVVSIFLSWMTRKVFPWLAKYVPTRFRLFVLGTAPVLRLLIVLAAILLILPMVIKFSAQNVVVIAGALSVAIGFAFKDLVSSLIAGVVAVFERPYRPGDWVRVGDDYGEIKDMGLRSFTMVTPADDVVTVAHDRLWEQNIVNSNDGADTLMCVANFYLMPRHDPRQVRALLREVALTSPYVSYRKRVFVELEERSFATHYKVKAYPFDMRDQFRFISDITARGKLELRKIGAEEAAAPTAVSTRSAGGLP